MDGQKIINVADGDVKKDSKDAVNGGQLFNEAAKATTEVTEGKNVTVTKTTGTDGHDIYNVALKDDIDVANVKVGTVTVAGEVKSSSANIGGVEIGGGNINAATANITNLGVANNIYAKLGTIGGVGLEGGNVAATTGTIGGWKFTANTIGTDTLSEKSIVIGNDSYSLTNLKPLMDTAKTIDWGMVNYFLGRDDVQEAMKDAQTKIVSGVISDKIKPVDLIRKSPAILEATSKWINWDKLNENEAKGLNALSEGNVIGDKATIGGVTIGEKDATTGLSKISGVADGVDAHDAATVGQVSTTLNGYVAYAKKADGTVNKDLVKFDGGEKGTALQNVGDITMKVPVYEQGKWGDNGTLLGYESRSFQSAGIAPGKVENGEGVAISRKSSIKNASGSVAIGMATVDMSNTKDTGAEGVGPWNGIAIGTGSRVKDAPNGIALGSYSTVDDSDWSTALGSGTTIGTSKNAVALGHNAGVDGSDYGISIGAGTKSKNSANTIVMGSNSTIENAANAIAIGSHITQAGEESSALGYYANANGRRSVAIGSNSGALKEEAVAIGYNSLANQVNTVAIGAESVAKVTNSTAIGFKSQALASQSTAIGQNAQAKAEQSVALGEDSIATDEKTVSVGNDSWLKRRITNVAAGTGDYDAVNVKQLNDKAADLTKDLKADITATNKTIANTGILGGTTSGNENDGAIALGKGSNAGWNAIAVGSNAQAKKSGSVAFGIDSKALSDNATAVGQGSQAMGGQSSAVGQFARALEYRATAYGSNAIAGATNSSALGGNSRADGVYSVAIGNDSVATEENTISVGHKVGDKKAYEADGKYDTALTRRITNVADGKDATDAATVGQVNSTLNGYVAYAKKADGTVNKDLVKFDGGEKGTALQNVGDITMKVPFQDKDNGYKVTYQERSFRSAGLMPGQVIFDDNFKPTPGNEKEVKGNVVAIGHNAKSYNSSGSTVVGEFSNIDNSHWSTALGAGVTVTNSSQSVSIGNNSTLTDSGASVAVGQGSKVFKSDQSQAIGFGAAIYGGYENGKYIITQGNIALGTGSGVDAANNSVALGSYSKVTKGQDNVVSVGSTSLKRKIINVADGNIAVGSHDAVTGGQLAAAGIIPGTYWKKQDTDDVWDNVIIGEGSHISTDGNSMDNVVVGSGAYVNAKTAGTVVLGRSAGVGSNSSYALAIGKDSGVGDWAENSMALGTGAKVEAGDAYNHITNAVALGSGSIANAANTVSFGSDNLKRRLTNVADGVNPNDAVNKSQMEKADQLVKENVTSTFNSKFQQLQDSLSASGNDTAANATAIANLKIAGVTGGTVTNSNSSIALGKGASVTYSDHFGYDDEGNPIQPGVGPWNSIAIGQASSIEDSANSIVIGGGANGGASGVINSNNGIALGSHSHVKNAKNGVAIGANTGVHAEGSVALGAFSSAKDPYTISVGRQIGDPDSDGDAAKSAVTRRIVNVAAGTGDNDAVIVSQFNGKGGAGDASFLSAVGKIDWKAVGEKADAINAAVEKMGGTTTTTTATKSLANAKFSLLSAVQPTMLAADETAPTDEATGSREPVKKDDGNTSGGTGSTPTSISGITTSANAVSVDRDLDVTGNATVGKELTVKGNSTFEGTAKFQKGADMGNNKVTNVADGAVDKDSKDAINGSQLYTEQQDRIAGDNALGGRIDTLSGQVNKLGGEIDSVGAISAALAGLHPLDYNPANSKYQLAAAFGGYDGSYALALGGFYNVNQDILLSGGVSTILKGERKTAGNVGVTFRVGAGNSAKDLGTPADLKEANQQLAALKQDNKVLTGENRKLAEKVESQDQKIADLEAKFEELLKKVK